MSKLRRPQATKLSVGQVLYDPEYRRYENNPVPTRSPELKSEGLLLFRTHAYDSSQAVRFDPFWEDYEGWMLIPEIINGRDGLQDFFEEFPKILETPHQVFNLRGADTKTWKMAKWERVDAFVCGMTNEKPALIPFQPPSQEEVIEYRAVIGLTGNFECFNLCWLNQWIVYVPRVHSSNKDQNQRT